MTLKLSNYETILFDCDGVLLNSNQIKTQAFRSSALPWGECAADALVQHHVANGGISRHRKLQYFIDTILPNYLTGGIDENNRPVFEVLLADYSREVRERLLTCAVAEGLPELRRQTPNASWLIVSGGDQYELHDIFAARGLKDFFDGGIYGSPDSKDIIVSRELASGVIRLPALFLGDSCYDYEVAQRAGLDFLFVSDWTEVVGWQDFVETNGLKSIGNLVDLVSL